MRFATIGTNFITEWFLTAVSQAREAGAELEYRALYSRDEEKGRRFGRAYGVEQVYTDLETLADAADVDGVYIGSPNGLHFQQAALLLSRGKHVLCEKTITSNRKELEELVELARTNKVVLMEAMRSVFDPGFLAVENNLHKLGTVRRATFSYCQYSSRYDKFKQGIVENAFNPQLSNGALMDIGVYCVHPAVKLFGMPKRISAEAVFLENGVDGAGTALLGYDHMQAELLYSKIADSSLPSQIQGELGSMEITTITNPSRVEIVYRGGERETVYEGEPGLNMVHEVLAWSKLVEASDWQHSHLIHSLNELAVMDEIRRITGIRFPGDRT